MAVFAFAEEDAAAFFLVADDDDTAARVTTSSSSATTADVANFFLVRADAARDGVRGFDLDDAVAAAAAASASAASAAAFFALRLIARAVMDGGRVLTLASPTRRSAH